VVDINILPQLASGSSLLTSIEAESLTSRIATRPLDNTIITKSLKSMLGFQCRSNSEVSGVETNKYER